MSTTYTLATLNILRTAVGMKPLKAWKESKAKLEAAVAKLSNGKDVTDLTPNKELKSQLEASVKEVDKKKAKTQTKKDKDEGPSISTIAEECDMDPKVARAKMRRAFGLKEEGKWPTSMADIKKVLKGDARKKA